MIWNQQTGIMQEDFITRPMPETTTILNLADGNYIHTPSVVFRNNAAVFETLKLMENMPAGDYPLWMIIAQYGKIKKHR